MSEEKIVRTLDQQFIKLHERSVQLVQRVPASKLYWQPRQNAKVFPVYSCGEHILRSAAAVEQTFSGITVNLWDDPFEWTLPESLSTNQRIEDYLIEVESTRARAFALFKTDAELLKEIVTPSSEMQTLFQLISETLVRAAHHQGRAFATFRLFSDERLSAF